jgi:hypothetical protein
MSQSRIRTSVSNGTKGSPAQGESIRKRSSSRFKRLTPDSDTVFIQPSRGNNESGEEDSEGEKDDATQGKEEEEVHSKHPMQVHGEGELSPRHGHAQGRVPRSTAPPSPGRRLQTVLFATTFLDKGLFRANATDLTNHSPQSGLETIHLAHGANLVVAANLDKA